MECCMDRENSSGLMVSHTKAAFIIIVYRERENTIGQTGLPMKGMLSVVCEMDLANLFLQIQMSSTRVSGKMVKGREKESWYSNLELCMREIFLKDKSMEREP